MAARPANRTIVITVIALVAALALGYWGYGAYQKRELRSAISAILKDVSGRLREGLSLEAGPAPADRLAVAKKIDEHAAAADKAIAKLKRLQVERDRTLSDNADGHLLTIREILRKRAAANRLYVLHAESLEALQDHMRVDNRTGAWVRLAVRAKERAEKDFRDYRRAVSAYGTLLGTLPASQKRIAPFVGAGVLVEEDLLVKARERAIETATQAAAEMEKIRKLAAPK